MGFGKFLGCIAGGIACVVFAPAIGALASVAGLGAAAGTLSGAAASSAGLAALGGGSIAAGGLGMAGGTAVCAAGGAIAGSAGAALADSFIDNVVRDKVGEPKPGSLLYCDLHIGEHSGIYIGNNKIVHLNGNGDIQAVSPKQFIDRMGGFNTAISIYVSCCGQVSVGSATVAMRAKFMKGKKKGYNAVFDNCHEFAAGCLTGEFNNPYNFLWMLKNEAEKVLGADTWRVWDIDPNELFG